MRSGKNNLEDNIIEKKLTKDGSSIFQDVSEDGERAFISIPKEDSELFGIDGK
ncbi:MAG TPA: hypothetical protein VNM45_02360 [Bacillus sp. (in: firmicutes)]|nr:hypothetical protein [Bacillus sp. (in: firmicutes)]